MTKRDLKMTINTCVCEHSVQAHTQYGGLGACRIYGCGCINYKYKTTEGNRMNTLEKLENKILNLQGQLNETKELLSIEKKKRAHDFAVTSVPISMMDSEIRDSNNTESTRHTWMSRSVDGGFRIRVPIRLMTDSHLKNTFNVFVRGNHPCYEEMKNEMVRRGLL